MSPRQTKKGARAKSPGRAKRATSPGRAKRAKSPGRAKRAKSPGRAKRAKSPGHTRRPGLSSPISKSRTKGWIPVDDIGEQLGFVALGRNDRRYTWVAPAGDVIVRYGVVTYFVKPVTIDLGSRGGVQRSAALVELFTTKKERDAAFRNLVSRADPREREWRNFKFPKSLKKVGNPARWFVRS